MLGDKVRQQTAPNKDVQKEIGEATEVSEAEGPPPLPRLLWGCPVSLSRLCRPSAQRSSPSGGKTR